MILNTTRSNILHVCFYRVPNYPISLHDEHFLRHMIVEDRKCTKWPHNNIKPLTVKHTLYIYTNYLPMKPPILLCFALCLFSRHKIVENQKCTELSRNDLKTLNNKSSFTPEGPPHEAEIGTFHSTTCSFQHTRLSKIRIHRMTPNWTWPLKS